MAKSDNDRHRGSQTKGSKKCTTAGDYPMITVGQRALYAGRVPTLSVGSTYACPRSFCAYNRTICTEGSDKIGRNTT